MLKQADARRTGPNYGLLSLPLSSSPFGLRRSGKVGTGLLGIATALAVVTSPLLAEAGIKVASVYCSADSSAQSDVQQKLQNTKLFDQVDNIDMGASAPALSALTPYDALLIWADTSRGCSDSTNAGNVIAQYIDAGGGVVQMLPYYLNNTYYNVSGDFYNRYALVNENSMTGSHGLTMGMAAMSHPVTANVMSVNNSGNNCYSRYNLGSGDLRNGGGIILSWSDGTGMVVVGTKNGHNRVDLNMYPVSSDTGYSGCLDPTSDAYKLIGQALIWSANPLRATPSSAAFGTVLVGSTSAPLDLTVTNNGKAALTLSGGMLSVMGEYSVQLLGGAAFPVTLNPGDSLGLEFTVRPSVSGSRAANYVLTSSTPGASGLTIPLTTTGLGPVIQVTPTTIPFGGLLSGSMASPVTVTVTNNGGGLLTLTSAPTLTDSTNFQIISPPMTPVSLAAGASLSFEVNFTPSAQKSYTATLGIPWSDGTTNSTFNVPLSGSYGEPQIGVPGTIIMTPVRVGSMGPAQGINITNSGLANLSITSVAFTGTNASEFGALTMPSMGMPLVIAPGASGVLNVQCNPTATGLAQATFNIVSNDPTTPTAQVNLQCNGVVANFDVAPPQLDFMTPQQTGQCSSPQLVTVTNSGSDNLHVTMLSFSGTNAASFQQMLGAGTHTVPKGGGTLQIPVQFCPVDIGAQTASLVITTDLAMGGTAQVPLSGTGTGPKVVANPGSLDFGPVYVNTTSMPQTISISNAGDQPLIFGTSSVTPNGSPFTVMGLPASGTKLNMGDPPIVLTVTVNPLMAMQQSANIAIQVNDLVDMGTLNIPLSVLGTVAELSVMPTMVTFQTTDVHQTSMPQMITVTNTGQAALTGINVEIIGTNAPDFVADQTKIPASVAMGQSIQFPLYFKPTDQNTRTAIMAVTASGVTAPVQVPLTGNGKILSVTCTPDSYDFMNTPIGMAKMTTLECRNYDTDPINYVLSFSDFPNDWSISPAMGTINGMMGQVEGSVVLNLTFNPTASGPRTTNLDIKTSDGIDVGMVSLDGTGTTPVQPKMDMGVGCSYGGSSAPPHAVFLMLLVLGGLALRRRRFIF